MKIIIVGCGKVGRTLAEQLTAEKHEITIIDNNPDVLQNAIHSLDVMGVVGNGARLHTQLEAGVKEADLLIAVATSDELNLLCCLIAKKAGGCQTIARVRNPEYNDEISLIKEELGLSMHINPDRAAASEMARIIRVPSAIKVDTFMKGRIELLHLHIPSGSILDQMRIADISARFRYNVFVCAVERNNEVVIPSGRFLLRANDKISIIVSPKDAEVFFKSIGIRSNQIRDVMLIGGSRIAYYLAQQLIREGIGVKIIEKDMNRCKQLSEMLPQALLIHGDATNQQILLEEGITRVDAIANLTNLDEENILLSLYAASKSKAKIITKVNRVTFEEVIDGMNLGSVVYPKYITSNLILRYVRAMQNSMGSNVETLYKIINNKVEALEFRVRENSNIVGRPLEELVLKENLLVGCINRKGKVFTPNGKDALMVGDTVIIVTTNSGLNDLGSILKN
ncbi:MAG: Trk system potassium transporter TrkA [Lachnospiraceae bacterium]